MMRLYYLPTSAQCRKVMVFAWETGQRDDVRVERLQPGQPRTEVLARNPMGRLPVLVGDEDIALYDATVICEYLDQRHALDPLFPPAGPARWAALKLDSLCDGLLAAVANRRMELDGHKAGAEDRAMVERLEVATDSLLDALERDAAAGAFAGGITVGHVALGCALADLDLHLPAEDWRAGRAALADWFATFAERPSMRQTRPR